MDCFVITVSDIRVFAKRAFSCQLLPVLNEKSKIKMLPVPGIEPTTLRSQVPCSTDWARVDSVGDVCTELSFVSCTTSHVGLSLFLESIEHDFIRALLIHTYNQIVTVSRAWDLWSEGCGFNSGCGQHFYFALLLQYCQELAGIGRKRLVLQKLDYDQETRRFPDW